MPLAYNSTIATKLSTCEGCGVASKIFSRKSGKALCHACAMQNRSPIKKISDKRMESFQDNDLQTLIDECDTVFSRYIRIKYSRPDGICECYTCGTEQRYQNLQNGHFIPRANLATRFLEENCKPQCVGCNINARGNMKVFEQKLESEHKGIVDWLREQGNSVYKPSRTELKELLIQIRNRLKIAQLKLTH
jgi:hypothetical protein